MTPELKKNIAPAKTARGRERSKALLLSAIDVFIENGYEGTSLSSIIEKAGGSRTTIYRLYGNKEGLFLAALQLMVDEVYFAYLAEHKEGRPYAEELEIFGRIFLTSMLTPRALGCSRLVFAAAARSPKIGRWYYKEGAELSYLCFAKVLENSLDLPSKDLKEIALYYIETLKSKLVMHALCCPDYRPGKEEIEKEVAFCVSLFMSYIEKKLAAKKSD